MKLLIGSYTVESDSKGIYGVNLDLNKGSLDSAVLSTLAINPSFLLSHPHLPIIYCVNELSGSDDAGRVSWFNLSPDGTCHFAGEVASGGQDPCHLAINRQASLLAVSNYTSGSLSVIAVNSDGSLEQPLYTQSHAARWQERMNRKDRNRRRQQAAHVHSTLFSNDGQCLFIADLGSDEWLCQRISPAGQLHSALIAVKFPGGAGPRHFCLSPSGEIAYVVTELSNRLVTIKLMTQAAELTDQQSCLGGSTGFSEAAEVQLTEDGRFLYVSNRGADSIAAFAVVEGKLSLLQVVAAHGRHPRHFLLVPGYLIVASRDDNRLILLQRSSVSGRLSSKPVAEITLPSPVHILAIA
jgi:6-phosphogluconolactonase